MSKLLYLFIKTVTYSVVVVTIYMISEYTHDQWFNKGFGDGYVKGYDAAILRVSRMQHLPEFSTCIREQIKKDTTP